MKPKVKHVVTLAVLAAGLVLVQPGRATAQWAVPAYSYGNYYSGYYTPGYYPYTISGSYFAYRSGYVTPIPYATYYNYRPFYSYVLPARAWVYDLPSAPVYGAQPLGTAPCGCH